MRVFVVRHGESGWNRAGLIQGQSPLAPGLTETGRSQVAAAAATLQDAGVGLVLSSGLRRALDTGTILGQHLGVRVVVEPRLEERRLGSAEGRPSASYPAGPLGVADGRVVDPDAAPPGGESVRELVGRVADLLEELARRPGGPAIALSTHGGVVRAVRGLVAGEAPGTMRWGPVGNAAVVEVEVAERHLAAWGCWRGER